MRAVMSVAAFPMSIWETAMRYGRPSSASALVRPVSACLVAVYGAECGRGVCAEIDPLLMIRPPWGHLPVERSREWGRILLLQLPVRRLRAQERPVEVRVHDVPPRLVRQILDRHPARPERPRVVEQQIEPPEPLTHGREQGGHVVGSGHVRAYDERGAVLRTLGCERRRLLQALGTASRERHRPARAEQFEGDRAPDAGTGSGDDRDFPLLGGRRLALAHQRASPG
jgi:hypothetical protein